jgi:hypothetical protein
MSIVTSFICTTLNIPSQQVGSHLRSLVQRCPVSMNMSNSIDDLLTANACIQDDLWRFSLALDVPHALLCESYWLQQKAESHRKVG